MDGPRTQPHKTERELFLEALERPTPGERTAFLGEACAHEPSLRAAIEALLQYHKEDGFLESSAIVVPPLVARSEDDFGVATPVVVGERPGDQIGCYRLLEQIGEGGVGVVFMADQEVPVRRRVALKVLKPGMDTKAVVARFELERQALALMDHPNIAKVLDAGSTATGRPYVVMELVRGVRITEYCDDGRLPTCERLALFIQVCHAIQHAHQKGIIHRDIKPSNILVTLHDGVPVPKVIDFGIAKAIDQRLTDRTFFTEFQSFIGTPAYISPEQAEMSGLDIDTRADIYSLGVLLYEVLTGKTPFDARELLSSGLDGMRRTIREQEPAPPSTRLGSLPEDERTTTAHRQRAEPAKLVSQLRGDLDWIALKALEKDRTRRYATANDLALDIRRYLDNEPIHARPPSAGYRFQKLVRRNKLVFAGTSAVAAALVIGLALSAWQFVEKSAAYRRVVDAEQEQSRLRYEAEAAGRLAEAQALVATHQAYAADMNLVQQALAANNLGRAQELLNRHRPEGIATIQSPVPENGSAVDSRRSTELRGWEWRYLWQQCQSDALFTLCQLPTEISALSVSYDGKWVAVGEHGDRGISIWDLRARQEIARFPAGEASERFAFSPVAPLLAFYAKDRTNHGRVRVWNVVERRVVGELSVSGSCRSVAFSADGTKLLSASGDTEFTVWSVAQGVKLAGVTVSEPKGGGRGPFRDCLAVTRDLSLAVQAIGGGRIRVIDLVSGQERWTAQAADEDVTALTFSPDGKNVVSGAGYVESSVRLWDVADGRELVRLEGHRTYVRSLVFWPDGETLASASGDQTIHLWDVSNLASLAAPLSPAESRSDDPLRRHATRPRVTELKPSATLRGHHLEVWSLALSPDNSTLVSGCKDGSVCVWDTSAVRRKQAHVTLPVAVRAWSFLPVDPAILALDEQGSVARWHGAQFQESVPLLKLGTKPLAAHVSADGRFMATASPKGTIQVWDLQLGGLLREVTSKDGWGFPVTFLGRSGRLVTQRGRNVGFCEWDVTSGQEIRSWRLTAPAFPWMSAFSPDEQWLFALDREGTGQLRHLATGQETRLGPLLKQVSGAAFSPDGRLLALVSVLGLGQIWDTTTARTTGTLQGFLQGAHSVAFSPDGQRLAIGSNGNEAIKLWDVESLQELLTLKGQGSMFNSTSFSPEDSLLASSNSRGILHIWSAPSFEEIARLEAQRR